MINAQVSRKEYERGRLDRNELDPNPIEQFRIWFEAAVAYSKYEANSVALATASAGGVPSLRMVLLKGFDAEGFVFATNYESRKGKELAENPNAALLFFWAELERQIRIEGLVEKTSPEESDEIFNSRPLGGRIAAMSSDQSRPIENRELMEETFALNSGISDPARPANWGGYRLRPSLFEFWQGGVNRMHDRFEYVWADGAWTIQRLQP